MIRKGPSMIECIIENSINLDDPFYVPEIMTPLSDRRKEKILRYKQPEDRKRSLRAGIMIHENLLRHGKNPEDITISKNGRPSIEGLDFNISHSGKYVIMAISDTEVGCDIEHIRDRNVTPAKKCFSENELSWMNESDEPTLSFYRIWTARESYIKLTGEGILLEFDRYEISFDDEKCRDIPINLTAKFLGSAHIIRDKKTQEYIIYQWLYDEEYVVSVCIAGVESAETR